MGSPPRHIAVDGRELLGRATGVGRYLSALLHQWTVSDPTPHRYTVIAPAMRPESLALPADRVEWVVDPRARGAGTVWEQWRLPALLRTVQPDVLFAPGYTAPLRSPCPYVVAVYDVSFWAHPEWFSWREGLRRRWLTRAAARRAASVVTISEFSAAEITRWLDVPRAQQRLAPPGPPAVHSITRVAPAPIVLYVGSLLARRHVDDLIRAFASIAPRHPAARLILVGDNRMGRDVDIRALLAAAGGADRIEWREYVSDAELDALYAQARVFVFLSDYEGFAMTPMEAIAHGVPAILLDTPVAREVYGDAALRLRSIDELPTALTDLLTNDRAHRHWMEAGRARLSHYSWAAAARTVTAALEEAAS